MRTFISIETALYGVTNCFIIYRENGIPMVTQPQRGVFVPLDEEYIAEITIRRIPEEEGE